MRIAVRNKRLASVLFSLGLALSARTAAETLIPPRATWAYQEGLQEASTPDRTSWRFLNFNDSAWRRGSMPFFYGEPLEGTRLENMRGNYTSLFARYPFVISQVGNVSELNLRILSDDGFIAWINGVEVARYNMPAGEILFDETSLGALSEPIPAEAYTLSDPRSYLVAGTNILAIHAFNTSLSGSSDFVLDASLTSLQDESPPVVTNTIPPAGALVRALTRLEVQFNEPVIGVKASDLLINNQPAQRVTDYSPTQYLFEFSQPATGTVRLAWSSHQQIHDLAGASNRFAGGSWSYLLDPNAPPPGLMISEFMADNDDTLNDDDGDSSDWIEIHNAGTTPIGLAGYYLTDQTNLLAKWRFPNVTIGAGSSLVVFASEKNRTNPAARLHTNFKLEKNGEYLALVDAQTNILSEFAPAYPAQPKDVSYGRDRGNPAILGFFTKPTPGAANASSGPGFASAVAFSHPAGTFLAPFNLTLSAASTNAVIHYTLDGSVPDIASPVYSGPIRITDTVEVRARAFESGLLPGPIQSGHYIALNGNVANFTSDLPIVVIHNFGAGTVPADGDQLASISFYEPVNGRSSLTNSPALSSRASINIRGSSTAGLPKKSFAVEFWDEYDADRRLAPLGLPADSDWVLYAPNNFEPVLIHNPFIFQLSRDIGRYAPRTRFVEVYLNISGGSVGSSHYNGVYVLMEKIKRGSDRVDVEKLEPEHRNPPQLTGGYIMKIDRRDPGDSGFSAANQGIAYVEPKEEEMEEPQRSAQRQYLQSYMDAFGKALYGSNYANPTNGYAAYLEVDSWIDHHLLNVLAFNVDALRLSAYFFKPRNGKLEFGPIWDFDRALGSTDGRDSNPRVWRAQSGDRGTDFFNYPWWDRLFTDPAFWQKWIDRYQELRRNEFSTTNLHALVDRFTSQVREAQTREVVKWPNLTRPRGSYQNEINLMKQWLSDRVTWMDSQFLAPPTPNRPAGPISADFKLSLAGPAGATIYFTLNGIDPRLPNGSVSPAARTYSGPINLSTNIRVMARSYHRNHSNLTGPDNPPLSSPWSGLTDATYVVAPPPLVITEIMYHPAAAGSDDSGSPELEEFIELQNVGNSPLDLGGFQLTRGIQFNFTTSSIPRLAAGERALLVKDRAAFVNRYDSTLPIAGEYTGRLDNSGERITLVGPLREPIHDFAYDPEWHPQADGNGQSLNIVNPQGPLDGWALSNAWFAANPTPGAPSATPQLDQDADGLPDEWEIRYGLDPQVAAGEDGPSGDPDGDGASNLEEFQAATAPNDAGSYLGFSSIQVAGNGIQLRFRASASVPYVVLFCDRLEDGSWHTLQEIPAPAQAGEIEVTDPLPARSRFYRLSAGGR